GQHADHHDLRRGRRGRALPCLDARSDESAAYVRRQDRLLAGFLRTRDLSDRLGPAQRRNLLHGAVQGLYLRAHVSRRELVLEQAKQKFEFPIHWGVDLQSEHERYISETHARKPVILMNYPKEIKAFYMRLNDDQKTVAAMDVLVPGIGEIVGGSQREERLEILDARMTQAKLDKEHYSWYRDLR